MKEISKKGLLLICIYTLLLSSCRESPVYDLAITNVNLFDPETKRILENKTIAIHADSVAGIFDQSDVVNSRIVYRGNHRLACPGFIDTHMHLSDLFGGYEQAPASLHVDSLEYYRKRLAEEYLNYGVTTVRDAGHTEDWLDVSLLLQQDSEPCFPNIILSGAAIISDEEREPYRGHTEVKDASDARNKVIEYHKLGIGQIKLYWRLRETEMESILAAADSLNMNVFGHFDNNVIPIPTALNAGVTHFEHALTLFKSVFDFRRYWNDFQQSYYRNFPELSFATLTLEIFRYVDTVPELNKELNALISEMKDKETTLSTSLHIFGSFIDQAVYETQVPVDLKNGKAFEDLNESQKRRLIEDFDILMRYCRIVHDNGILLCIGTDCPNGGKALLSELILLAEAGFEMADILQIATINGALAMDRAHALGSIKVGKAADLVIFERDPFENYLNLLSERIIIKDGKIVDRNP
jgi:imidazolonepropionase-like amidohydrolase